MSQQKGFWPMQRLFLSLSLLVAMMTCLGSVGVQASSTEIDAPGIQVQQKNGWFGTSDKTYRDALGNTYTVHHGLFGRHKTQGSLMGTQVTETNRGVSVMGRDGQPLIERKRTWFHGTQTRINGNGIWQNTKDLFNKN
jgi:hypothetical protein